MTDIYNGKFTGAEVDEYLKKIRDLNIIGVTELEKRNINTSNTEYNFMSKIEANKADILELESELTSGLANKANKDLSNATFDYDKKSMITSWGIPYYNAGVGGLGYNITYTATSNGFIYIHFVRSSSGSGTITLYINNVSWNMMSNDHADEYILWPIKKDSPYKVVYSGSGLTTLDIRWYPCYDGYI